MCSLEKKGQRVPDPCILSSIPVFIHPVPGNVEQGDHHQKECEDSVENLGALAAPPEMELGEHQLQQNCQQQGGGQQLCQGGQVPSIA